MEKRIQLLATLTLTVIGIVLSPKSQAVVPPPDGGYPNFNTAEGQNALSNLTTGVGNVAAGWYSLFSNTDGSFNTAVGAGSLLFNVGSQGVHEGVENTAVGAAALLSNTVGFSNTAIGAATLVNNTTGGDNTASGFSALQSNTSGGLNTANGVEALQSNTSGSLNTANGVSALQNNIAGHDNTAVGFGALINSTGSGSIAIGSNAGKLVGSSNNVIAIGSPGDDVDNSCFIGNISGVEVTGDPVVVNANGQLGVAIPGSPLSVNELLKQQRIVQELKATTDRQAAVIALQEGQIKALTAGLQKVNAQLEATKPVR